MSDVFVCVMGMGTVFTGLICIVLICMVVSFFVRITTKGSAKKETAAPASVAAPAVANTDLPIENKQAIIAGTCAVIAEELGTDVSNIRVLSFKRI